MATCAVTAKKGLFGNKVSHANNKTLRRQLPGVHSKRLWDAENKRWVRLNISNRGLRFLNKMTFAELRRKYGINN
jgi:large subunit ribosomal protein L28